MKVIIFALLLVVGVTCQKISVGVNPLATTTSDDNNGVVDSKSVDTNPIVPLTNAYTTLDLTSTSIPTLTPAQCEDTLQALLACARRDKEAAGIPAYCLQETTTPLVNVLVCQILELPLADYFPTKKNDEDHVQQEIISEK
eukprot:TRINITY_DN6629_c0_g2_i11.p2 TRINITY_DN6629_c0_g2~~TRINITY_DN6629_c0_g2_i11.p2  ORF type:complete len:164 (+),score=33.88 TRINITY_DN6629_c0_g2_i11:72-494(+)